MSREPRKHTSFHTDVAWIDSLGFAWEEKPLGFSKPYVRQELVQKYFELSRDAVSNEDWNEVNRLAQIIAPLDTPDPEGEARD